MRRTRHRRRFHTDRIVEARRARYLREERAWVGRAEAAAVNRAEWLAVRLSYGRLASMDPWDCGSSCWLCHYGKREAGQRTREKREWRAEVSRAY